VVLDLAIASVSTQFFTGLIENDSPLGMSKTKISAKGIENEILTVYSMIITGLETRGKWKA
jgi:hypothetical protein